MARSILLKLVLPWRTLMNIKVVAEGIETQWQYDFLAAEGCDIGQGYFLHKPMGTDQFEQLLKKFSLTAS